MFSDLYTFTKNQYNDVVELRNSQAKARIDFFIINKARIDQLNKLIDNDK